MSAPVLEVSGVERSFDDHTGPRRVIGGVDLTVDAGEIVALVGPSGSGKTTLLSIVAGFEQPDAGTVHVAGAEVARPPAWTEVAMVPQSLGLLGELTVAENVALPLRLGAAPAGAVSDPDELLAQLGLDHLRDRHPHEISLGEQQRTALARAAVVRPRLLVADEPVSHQNHARAEDVMRVVVGLAAAGTACLLATHDEVAVSAADRVVELRDGRVRGEHRPR